MREVVFVFGSNLAGRHGKGAALEAVRHWGAQYGVGEGRTGNAYALPTKDARLKTLPLEDIRQSFIRFWKYAFRHPETQFLLTPFGTGLAGYHVSEIRSVMSGGPLRNVWESGDWQSAQGTSAFGQDAQRLEAKPAGPVAEGHAPNTDHDILKGDAGQPNKRGATSHDRDNNASGKGIE